MPEKEEESGDETGKISLDKGEQRPMLGIKSSLSQGFTRKLIFLFSSPHIIPYSNPKKRMQLGAVSRGDGVSWIENVSVIIRTITITTSPVSVHSHCTSLIRALVLFLSLSFVNRKCVGIEYCASGPFSISPFWIRIGPEPVLH